MRGIVLRRFGPWLGVVLAGLALGAPPAWSFQLSHEVAKMYADVDATPPTAGRMMVCYGFVCRLRTFLDFSGADRAALTAILAKGRSTPAAEREAMRQAVVWFDRKMGPVLGTSRRVARADIRSGDSNHNFDCFDTTRNTVSLMLVLQEWGLLKHHTVDNPRFRGNMLVGQTPHNTAVLREKAAPRLWAVDMWPKAYGQLPDVMPVEKWLDEK